MAGIYVNGEARSADKASFRIIQTREDPLHCRMILSTLDEKLVEALYPSCPNLQTILADRMNNTSLHLGCLTRFEKFRSLEFDDTSETLIEVTLDGIQDMPHLERVRIPCSITPSLDMTPLAQAESLHTFAFGGRLSSIDLSSVHRSPSLEDLSLFGLHLPHLDLSGLDGSPVLRRLRLSHITLTLEQLVEHDIDGITLQLPQVDALKILSIGNSPQVRSIDLSPLQNSSLEELTLHGGFDRVDLSPITHCPLKDIFFSSNLQEVDLSPLEGNGTLKEINLKQTKLKEIDLGPLIDCPSLKSVKIDKAVVVHLPSSIKSRTVLPHWLKTKISRNTVVWY